MTWNVQPIRRTNTLLPSLVAIGPNKYLGTFDFQKMVLLAIVAHLAILGLSSLMPEQKITNIPVHSLSFKIGENQRIQTFAPKPVMLPEVKEAPKISAAPITKKSAPAKKAELPKLQPNPAKPASPKIPEWKPASAEKSVVKNVQKAAVESVEAKPLPAPVANTPPVIAPRQIPQENQAEIKKESSLFDFLMLPINRITGEDTSNKPPAIAETPQQYVREHGAAPIAQPGAIDGLREQAHSTFSKSDTVSTVGGSADATSMSPEQQIRANYEKVISAWIQQHKIYPASARGREGRVILRVRIDRQGYVRYYALEESSGVATLNSAAIDMIRRANPVPAVPENYPAGNLIEFLIPISFEAP